MSNQVIVGDNRKLLSVGAAWVNTRDNNDPNKPALTIKIDQTLGFNLSLTPNAQVLLFVNKQHRADSQDPHYRVAVSLPAEIVDAEINRQRSIREQNATAAPTVVSPATPTAVPTLMPTMVQSTEPMIA